MAVGMGRSWFMLICECYWFHYYVMKGLDLWPYKVMFWEMKMTSITNQGTILRSYTLMLLPEPTPNRIPIKWLWQDYKEWSYQSFFIKVQLNLVFKLSAINGLPGLSWSVRYLYLTLMQLQIVIAVIINRFVWSTLTKSSTLTCAKTTAENLSSSHVTTLHRDDVDTAGQIGTTRLI